MQKNAENARIAAIHGSESHSCSCKKCQNMCKTCPCLGTPSDIRALIKAGYGDKMAPTLWAAGRHLGIPNIPMVQLIQKQDGSCILFKDGKCPLHDKGLKPVEGELAHHTPKMVQLPLPAMVAQTWTNSMNIEIINEIVDLLKK